MLPIKRNFLFVILPLQAFLPLASSAQMAARVDGYVPESSERTARVIPALFDMVGTLMPRWSEQSLIGVQDNQTSSPLIYLIDAAGRRDYFAFTIPEAGNISVHGLAVSPEGRVAISGTAVSGDAGAGSFLAIVEPDRKGQTVVRTWPFVPWEVIFVPDGSLWSVGYTFHETEERIVKPNVMAHFGRTGTLLGSFQIQARARFGAGKPAALQHSFLGKSSGLMGWFTNGMEYIEFSFDGHELARFDGPDVPDPVDAARRGSFALGSDGQVLFSTIENTSIVANQEPKAPARKTWTLDREQRRWVQVEFQDPSLPAWSELLGFDGNTLVVTSGRHDMRRYKRMRSPVH